MKKRIILVAVLLLAALSVGAVIYLNSPKVVARNALAGVAEDLLDRSELKPLVKMSQKGSLSFSAEIDTGAMYDNVSGDGYEVRRMDVSFGGKLYFGKKSLFLKNAYLDLAVPGEAIYFDAQADLYIGKNYAYLESDLLGGAVGIIKGEMTEALKHSELAPELPEELYRELLPAMKRYDGISPSQGKEDENLFIRHLAKLIASFEKHADYEARNREILLQGETVNCRVITVTLDRGDFLALLYQLSESLKDEALCKLINQNQWLLQPLLESAGLIPWGVPMETLSAYLTQRLDAEIAAQEKADADTRWIFELVTPRRSSKLLSLRFFTEDEMIFSLDVGKKGIQKTDRITVGVGDGVYAFSVVQKDENGYHAKLIGSFEGEEILLFSLSVDKNAKRFELCWWDGENDRQMDGDWIETKKSTAVTVERFTDARGNWIDEGFCVKMTFSIKASMPKALGKNEVRNIFDLTLDEALEFITKSRSLWRFFL